MGERRLPIQAAITAAVLVLLLSPPVYACVPVMTQEYVLVSFGIMVWVALALVYVKSILLHSEKLSKGLSTWAFAGISLR